MRLIVVSNRLPVVLERQGERIETKPGSGGLVTALAPILHRLGGVWIGWPGAEAEGVTDLDAILAEHGARAGHEIVPVRLSAAEMQGFYAGFSNRIIWPLFHDLQSLCNFDPEYWTIHSSVAGKFADAVAAVARHDDFIWVHDYHLMALGTHLRERGLRNPLGFFLHIPFPPPDIFAKLPWRIETLTSLLGFETLGFQTPRDAGNFTECVRRLLGKAKVRRRPDRMHEVTYLGRTSSVGSFPIGIDYDEFAHTAASDGVSRRVNELRSQMPESQILLGVDRLDYTKGIAYRLRAYRLALQRHPELHRKVALLQIVVPSRESVPEYQELRADIERLVTQVNGEFTQPGWVPIQHMFRSVERDELIAAYRAADVALVTPLKDGMNLVAKEYCACQIDGDGVLVLSEFAGVAFQFRRDALLVNPYDLEAMATAIHAGVTMPKARRRRTMRRLREVVRNEDVYWWVDCFFAATGCPIGPRLAGRIRAPAFESWPRAAGDGGDLVD